ncbi:hypothetical protein V1506DRAFT_525349 [Lipomyces tetrasporus]
MLKGSREDTKAGFQPILGKVMVGERHKDFFYEVQELATLENYSTIWAKVLWVACLAVTSIGTIHAGLELTQDQTASANDLVHDLERLKATPDVVDLATQSAALGNVVALSTHILRQQFEVVNRLLPTGESEASQYLVPRAISLLSLRPNGSFVSYLQITHVTAAMRDDVDEECSKFLTPQKSASFSYCVQAHAACNKFGQKHQVPTITWATNDFSAVRLQSGSILTINSLKSFIQEQYNVAEAALHELCLGLELPTHFARDLKDYYNIQQPGYSFFSETANHLLKQYLWDSMIGTASLRSRFTRGTEVLKEQAGSYLKKATEFLEGRLLAGGLYKVNNYIIEGYQQYLFTGYKGRFGVERLREIIQQKTSLSTTLHTKLNAQELRQALVAFLDQFAGHSKAVGSDNEDYAHDIQSGHSSRMAVTHYAISDQDLPSTNRYDVHVFMLVSEAWFELLGEESPGTGS